MNERRRTSRFTLIVAAEVAELPRGSKLHTRCTDLSATGCYLDTLHPLALGKSIRVKLVHCNEWFEATAKVVFVSPGLGMGIEFDGDLPESQRAILDGWFKEAEKLV